MGGEQFPQHHEALPVHLLSCPDIALLLHGVLVKFQQSISGVGGVETLLCEQRDSQLSQAVLFPSPYAFGIYKYHPWATIKSGFSAVKILVVAFQRADMNSQEKQTWPSVPCLDFFVVWKEVLGSAVGVDDHSGSFSN